MEELIIKVNKEGQKPLLNFLEDKKIKFEASIQESPDIALIVMLKITSDLIILLTKLIKYLRETEESSKINLIINNVKIDVNNITKNELKDVLK